jgi:hypothetical protein
MAAMKSFILQIAEKLQEVVPTGVLLITSDEFDGVTLKVKEHDKPGAKETVLLIPFEDFYKKGDKADGELLTLIFKNFKEGKKG